MKKQQRKIMITGYITMIPLLVAIIMVLIGENRPVSAHPADAVEEIAEETTECPNEAFLSAMPCDDPERFRRWLSEQEASEKEEAESISDSYGESKSVDLSSETEPETETEAADVVIYSIDGVLIDPDIQRALYEALEAEEIGYWYTGSLAQLFQESHGDSYAVNPNGLDMGILQYRITYWDWTDGDIFDTDAQIKRYAREMAARFNAGLSADQAISRHKTSDYCTEIDATYVADVRQWLGKMETYEIKKGDVEK